MQCGVHQASHLMRTRASYGEGKTTGLDHLHLRSAEDHHTCNFISATPTYLQVLSHCLREGILLVTTQYSLFGVAEI
jgi:hypothetical protein